MATVQYVLVCAFSMLLLITTANLMLGLYMRAAVHDALDDGVRAGVPIGSSADACQRRVDAAIGVLIHGRLGAGVTAQCSTSTTDVVATAHVQVPSFVPLLFAGWSFTARSSARVEQG